MKLRPEPPIDRTHDLKIAFVGEAPTHADEQEARLFAGVIGKEFTAMLSEANIIREEVYLTNTFLSRPRNGNIYNMCVKKKEADDYWKLMGNEGKYPFAPLKVGNYLHPKYLPEVTRLHKEILDYNPNIVVALGNTALWALSGISGIMKMRGTLMEVQLGDKFVKMLPTLDPNTLQRQWENRPVLVADLLKTKRESRSPKFVRPKRLLWLEPNLVDIGTFQRSYLDSAPEIACDIETAHGQITCIGFGTATHAICIPFVDYRKEGWNYWNSVTEEVRAMNIIKHILQSGSKIVFQNGMYDMIWMLVKWGMFPKATEDTMLMHHSMFSEMRKSLGFLGSIYTNEPSWKWMRPTKTATQKKDDD